MHRKNQNNSTSSSLKNEITASKTLDYNASQICDTKSFYPMDLSTPSIRDSDLVNLTNVFQALLAKTAPPSAATSWSGTKSSMSSSNKPINSFMHSLPPATHHLTCLMNSHNVENIGKNQNVPREFLPERNVVNVDSVDGLIIDKIVKVKCNRSECNQSAPLIKARSHYKSCHHCYTYYCSSLCRQLSWVYHKNNECPIGKSVSSAKRVLRHLFQDDLSLSTVSNLARGGYLRLGRGSVVLWLPDCETAERFSKSGFSDIKYYPTYVSVKSIENLSNNVAPFSLVSILECCKTYNPESHFVFNISVGIKFSDPILNLKRARLKNKHIHAVKKCMIIPLLRHLQNRLNSNDKSCTDANITSKYLTDSSTIFLTKLPENKISRRVIIVHLLRQLESHGILLRRDHSKLYCHLMKYAEGLCQLDNNLFHSFISEQGKRISLILTEINESDSSNMDNENSDTGSFISQIEAVTTNWNRSEITNV